MQHIVFNKTDYFAIPVALRPSYEHLGGSVYALDPHKMRINMDRLPKWLSRGQYSKHMRLIGPYYRLTTRGFLTEAVPLMELIPNVAHGIRRRYAAATMPKTTRITELTYWRLAPEERSKYKRLVIGGKVLYANTQIPTAKLAQIARPVIRQPVVGVSKVPSGSWVEVP